ncbi:MAG TPA: asparagine synthase (glutamine-hydrolyzing) [Thermoanaerobaculia bacterium]|nr:asparagine synthase (glutamine-hydrolyzing) [Thermoanaerobaculia bacterium]
MTDYNSRRVCGIYGITSSTAALKHPSVLELMGEALRHRGPDGRAVLTHPQAVIGTERLRIIDLHERADQPFATPDQQVWLEANGEIYNAAEIRARYPDFPYRSHSDVETILPLYLDRGADCVAMLDGMFGLAIWDSRTRTLLLARDRAGEKPLFYARVGGEVIFASELQCLLKHPDITRELDPIAIEEFLRLGYVPEPRTPFSAIRRVPAGSYMRFSPDGVETVHYWDPASFVIEPRDAREAVSELQRLFERAVTKQVMSDVPVGVFISGGLDSSLLATLASRAIGVDKVHTFSAQFAEESYDESGDAAVLAAWMRTKHVPVRTDEETLREALENVTRRVAEPLADPAILPTFLLARAAREHVKVILSGEGADELFGGYPTYIGHKIAPKYDAMPAFVRSALRRIVNAMPASGKKVTFEYLLKRFVSDAERPWVERHLAWFGTGLTSSVFANPPHALPELPHAEGPSEPLAAAMLLDYRSYLRDNLLVKVDRATMLSSVEARAPYLDRDLTKFALTLPSNLRLRGMTTKWVLKKAAEKWLPKDVIYRRKRGLSVPIASWINHGLRSEVDRLLEPERLRSEGIVNERHVRELLTEHRAGHANHAKPLWALITLQFWMELWSRS